MGKVQHVGDDDCMWFGQHRGTKMKDVPVTYLDWLDGQEWVHKDFRPLSEYISRNRKYIDDELKKQGVI